MVDKRLATANFKIFIVVLVCATIIVAIFALARLDTTGERGSGLGKAYDYDIDELAKTDPNLILYEQTTQPISTRFVHSRAIVVDSEGAICVAGDEAVRVLAETGNLLNEIRIDGAPTCLAVANDGKFYVGVEDHVEVYDGQGKRLASWQRPGDDAVLTSIAIWKDDVFVADAGNRVVLHYDAAGNLINRIGEKDQDRNVPGFVIPSPYFDLAVGRDGLLRVVNPGRHRIEAYTFEGDLEFWWGEFSAGVEGFCGCCNPVNFAILADDSFVTCEKGLVRVKICDPDGNFVGVVAGPEQLVEGGGSRVSEFGVVGQTGAFDVAVDTQGRIFVLDTIKNIVRIFTKIKAG